MRMRPAAYVFQSESLPALRSGGQNRADTSAPVCLAGHCGDCRLGGTYRLRRAPVAQFLAGAACDPASSRIHAHCLPAHQLLHAEGRPFWRDVLAGVSACPGQRRALADCTPGKGAATATLLFADRANDPDHAPPTQGCWISADFFKTSGTPLLHGRLLSTGRCRLPAVVMSIVKPRANTGPGRFPSASGSA